MVGLDAGERLEEGVRVKDPVLPPDRRGEMEDCPVTAHLCLCFR